jgi:hypothetical protein
VFRRQRRARDTGVLKVAGSSPTLVEARTHDISSYPNADNWSAGVGTLSPPAPSILDYQGVLYDGRGNYNNYL